MSSPNETARTYRSSCTAVEGTPRGSIISTPIGGVITVSATLAEMATVSFINAYREFPRYREGEHFSFRERDAWR